MKTIKVFVEKHEDGTYWGTTQDYEGVVSAFGTTFEDLKANLQEAFSDNLELAKELGEDYADKYTDVVFEWKVDLAHIFNLIPELNVSAIAEKAKMNTSLLRQYKTGKKTASPEQAKKIEEAMHELGRELLAVHF